MAEFGHNNIITDIQLTSTGNCWGHIDSGAIHTGVAGDVVTEIYMYMKSYNSGDFTCDVGVYSMSGGVPNLLIGTANTITGNGGTQQWYGVTGLSIALTAGVDYCLVVGNLTNGCRLHAQTVTGGTSNDTTTGILPATYTNSLTRDYLMNLYAVFTEASGISIDHTREVAVLTQAGLSLDRMNPVNTLGQISLDSIIPVSTLTDIFMSSILPIEILKSISARLELNIGNDSERSFSREIPVLVDTEISLDRFMNIDNLSTLVAFSTVKNLNIDWRVDSSHDRFMNIETLSLVVAFSTVKNLNIDWRIDSSQDRMIPVDSLSLISFIQNLPVSSLIEISDSLIMNIGSGKDFVFSVDLPISTLKSLSLTKDLPVEYSGQSVFGITLSNFTVRTPNINNFVVRTPNITNLRKS